MTDLLIFRARQPEAMRALIGKAGRARVQAINVDTDIFLPELPSTAELLRYGHILGEGGQDLAGVASLALSRSWYRTDGADPTIAYGLSFGRYIDYEMKRVFAVVCRHIAFLDALKPSRILVADDGSLIARASLAYASSRGVPAETVTADPVSEGTDWNLPGGSLRPRSAKERVQSVLCDLSWLSRHVGSADSLTVFVRPSSYTMPLAEAVLKGSRHRLILPSFVRSYVGNPRVMLTDWQIASRPSGLRASKVASWNGLKESMSRAEIVFRGVALWPVIEAVGKAFWDGAWDIFYVQAAYCTRVFETLKPDAVVVPQDQAGFDKLLVMLADRFGALSVYVSHGTEAVRPAGFPTANADVMAVLGEECRRLSAAPGHDVVMIGNDDLGRVPERIRSYDRSALRRRAGLGESHKPVILFAAGTFVNLWPAADPSDANETLQSMCRVAAEMPETTVVIRFHPSTHAYESIEVKREVVAHYNRGNVVIDPGLAPLEALAISDVVVTVDSTFGIEAVAAERPLVVFDPKRIDIVGYGRGAAGAAAHDETELRNVLQRLLGDPTFEAATRLQGQQFMTARVVGVGDGNAGSRLMAEIERRAAGRRNNEKLSA
jgi:hypothetical protein